MTSIDYLEDERQKLWSEITQLKKDVKKKTSDYEKEAKQASKMCSEYRNKSQIAKDEAEKALSTSKEVLSIINNKFNDLTELRNNIIAIGEEAVENKGRIDTLLQQVETIEQLIEKHEELEASLNSLTETFESSEEISNKINAVHTNILKRKNEIDEAYYEVFGYTDEDEETGEESRVEGLKDKLESSYDEIEKEFELTKEDIAASKKQTAIDYKSFVTQTQEKVTATLASWEQQYSALNLKIEGLLPQALTKGLSSAYSEKKKDEEESGKNHLLQFTTAIKGLVGISLIPFAVSLYLLIFMGKGLDQVIMDMPRLVLAILPLYIPVLWLAYSSNKKANLSKRLVEEYTHKEVLSKTFEGLSRQIDGVEDSDISSELRLKLLYNILEVSSENPGKLITDYNKSDHPLMDALDKSAQLANAVDNLSKIPGLSKVVRILEKKSDKVLADAAKDIEDALDAVTPDSISNKQK